MAPPRAVTAADPRIPTCPCLARLGHHTKLGCIMLNSEPTRDCGSKRTHEETVADAASCGDRARSQSHAGPLEVLVVGGTHPAPIIAMLAAHGMTATWWSGL